MAGDSTPEVGDKASWPWNGSHPSGEIVEKKDHGDLAIKSARGNTIKAPGSPSDPAMHLARPGNDVVKKQSDLDVETKGDGHPSSQTKDKAEQSKADEDKGLHLNGTSTADEPKTGDKRKATEEPAHDADDGAAGPAPEAKKARGRPKGAAGGSGTPKAKKEAGAEKKKPGRKPAAEKKAASATPKKEKVAKEPASAATADGGEVKKGRGRPKKDGSAAEANKTPRAKKEVKAKAQPVKGSMGTRTRSSRA